MIASPGWPARLHRLFDFLDSLRTRADVMELRNQIVSAKACVDDFAPFLRFDSRSYTRNLIVEGLMYHVLVLCWRSGQRSPIHNHAHSVCGFCILMGTATETIFERSPSGLTKPTTSRNCRRGDVCVSRDADIHQVANLQPRGHDLVTLHVYSPPLLHMDTFSEVGVAVGADQPACMEQGTGGGR